MFARLAQSDGYFVESNFKSFQSNGLRSRERGRASKEKREMSLRGGR